MSWIRRCIAEEFGELSAAFGGRMEEKYLLRSLELALPGIPYGQPFPGFFALSYVWVGSWS
jgi:hypothetical protein